MRYNANTEQQISQVINSKVIAAQDKQTRQDEMRKNALTAIKTSHSRNLFFSISFFFVYLNLVNENNMEAQLVKIIQND